jgi:thermopsin
MKRKSLFTVLVVLMTIIMISSFMESDLGFTSSHSSLNHSSVSNAGSTLNNTAHHLHYRSPNLNLSSNVSGKHGTWNSMENSLVGKLNSLKIPSIAKLPPNFEVSPKLQNGSILPSYTSSPAPMGIASYGIENKSGTLTPYSYSTKSFEGNLSMNSANELYMDGDSFNSFSIQLNAILNNVTLSGITEYQFWTQNVVDYSTSTHQLTFIDNIWNFSSSTAVMEKNTIRSGNGTVEPGVLYYDIGPTLNVSSPFNLHLILSTAKINGENTVFFNYTVTYKASDGKETTSTGSFDEVQFNSTIAGRTDSTPGASYEVSGSHLSNTGYIPMDAEMIIGGEGGGSNAQFININATMTLKYLDQSGQYQNIKSAYDVGSATGETSTGISEYYSGNVAYLNGGPSFVEPLWNVSSNPGYAIISGTLSPSNAFVFINKGSNVNNKTAQWAPISPNGGFTIKVSPGTYSMEELMSLHNPQFQSNITLSLHSIKDIGTIDLIKNNNTGIYTPFYASNNDQLKNLSLSGSGTLNNPFIVGGSGYFTSLRKNIPDQLSNLFSEVNDYLYPIFSGILIYNTTKNTIVEGMVGSQGTPAFQISYSDLNLAALIQSFGVTSTNYLQMIFYNSANIIIENNTLSGWFSTIVFSNYTAYNIPPVADLMLWNVTHSLIERNSIESQGSGVLIYNNNITNSQNYVWNNSFSNYNLISPGTLFGGAPIGLIIASSHNTIYNNKFKTTIPIVSLDGSLGNLYTDGKVTYENRFNITKKPSTNIKVIDGQKLFGSIISTAYQGGNYYYNYFGNGAQSYNGSGVGLVFNDQTIFNGSINYAYDHSPLVLYSYNVNIKATGLPRTQTGTINGYFDINNDILSVAASGTNICLPNGTYELNGIGLESKQYLFEPYLYEGITENPSGSFIVNGPMINLTLRYVEMLNITVSETGLPPNTLWGFSIPCLQEGYISSTNNVSFYIQPGTYEFLPQDAYGFEASNIPKINVSRPDQVVNIRYIYSNQLTSTYSITFMESGLPAGTQWEVNMNGVLYSSNGTTLEIINVPNGNYTYGILSIHGYQPISGGKIAINSSRVTVQLAFQKSVTIPIIAYIYMVIALIGGFGIGSALIYIKFKKVKN